MPTFFSDSEPPVPMGFMAISHSGIGYYGAVCKVVQHVWLTHGDSFDDVAQAMADYIGPEEAPERWHTLIPNVLWVAQPRSEEPSEL
jgi:hypothetical protein